MRALYTRFKREGPSQVDVTAIYNKLGDVQHDMGGLRQAKNGYDKALSILSPMFFSPLRFFLALGLVVSKFLLEECSTLSRNRT